MSEHIVNILTTAVQLTVLLVEVHCMLTEMVPPVQVGNTKCPHSLFVIDEKKTE